MRKLMTEIIFGKNTQISGLIAMVVVGLFVLGCNCNKQWGNISSSNSSIDTGPTPAPFNTSSSPTTTSTPFSGKKADASKLEIPGDSEMQDLAKTTLLSFNDAVLSDDFNDFYADICKPWKKQITADSLRTTFKQFIDKKIDISDIRTMTAQFSPSPTVSKVVGYQTLVVQGTYNTSPLATKFELNYIPEGKEWKLSKIDVDHTKESQ